MKGYMKVKELNKNGLFISEMDWDKCYKDKENPKGNFVVIIEPIEGTIYYQKLEDGFLIKGEAYILTGSKDDLEKEISEREYNKENCEFIEMSE